MTTFKRSPQLQRGALVTVDPQTQAQSRLEFQYNPESLTRRLEPQVMGGEGGDRIEVYRLTGPPKETITLSIELDATDDMEKGDQIVVKKGLNPVLSALELLVYPTADSVKDNDDRAGRGDIEIIPPEAPLTLFNWGNGRSLPVRITSFSITEQRFDPLLNPTIAKIELSLQVLSYNDFHHDHRGYGAFRAYHRAKEKTAEDFKGWNHPA